MASPAGSRAAPASIGSRKCVSLRPPRPRRFGMSKPEGPPRSNGISFDRQWPLGATLHEPRRRAPAAETPWLDAGGIRPALARHAAHRVALGVWPVRPAPAGVGEAAGVGRRVRRRPSDQAQRRAQAPGAAASLGFRRQSRTPCWPSPKPTGWPSATGSTPPSPARSRALGVASQAVPSNGLRQLAGTWSEAEYKQFEQAVAPLQES